MTDKPVSRYLLRPLRTEAEAARDIAERAGQVIDYEAERQFRALERIIAGDER